MRILLVEDDPDVQAPLLERLIAEGFDVDSCADGGEAIALGLENDYHAVILDPGLPVYSGEQIIKRWRQSGRDFPILIVTGTRTMSDQIRELIKLGASQYIGKPIIDYDILIEWVRSLSLSRGGVATGSVLRYGNYEIDVETSSLIYCGKRIMPGLSGEEFAVLRELVIAKGKSMTPTEISARALDESKSPKDSLVPIYVQRIRKKLGNNAILTAGGGRGYCV